LKKLAKYLTDKTRAKKCEKEKAFFDVEVEKEKKRKVKKRKEKKSVC
jgi:hypothetical protein